MARVFKPSTPYTVPCEVLVPSYGMVKGTPTKTYPEHGFMINVSWKTYGGTESTENDVLSVVDTAQVETWYRPDITAACRIKLRQSSEMYEIIGKPENVNMRNQYLRFKVQAVQGGA